MRWTQKWLSAIRKYARNRKENVNFMLAVKYEIIDSKTTITLNIFSM